jgi:hypothetical protein
MIDTTAAAPDISSLESSAVSDLAWGGSPYMEVVPKEVPPDGNFVRRASDGRVVSEQMYRNGMREGLGLRYNQLGYVCDAACYHHDVRMNNVSHAIMRKLDETPFLDTVSILIEEFLHGKEVALARHNTRKTKQAQRCIKRQTRYLNI